jgi:ribosomal protein S18 acetylase RimI-like enzyme
MIQYRAAVPEDYDAIRKLLIEVGWEKHVRDMRQFQQMLENSDRTVVAAEGVRIVGFARGICDGVSNGYITMVAVSRDKRGSGVGSQMVDTLIGNDPGIKWVLTSDENSIEFWEKKGFRLLKRAMMKPRGVEVPYHENPPTLTNKYTFKKFIWSLIGKIRNLIRRNLSSHR